jgi:hypothetical protein
MNRRRFLKRLLGGALGVGGLLVGGETLWYWLKSIEVSRLAALPTLSGDPLIVPREAWGALPPDHDALNERGFAEEISGQGWYEYAGDLAGIFHTAAIHHSGQWLAANETMRSLQDVHMQMNGWADIGYHFGIDGGGTIYAGRDLHVRGASVEGHNSGTIGIVLTGNFELEAPRDAQLASLQMLVNFLAQTYPLTHLAAHREFNPQSVCPGRFMMLYLDLLANGAGLARGTGGYSAR